jgi:hypothetical protein
MIGGSYMPIFARTEALSEMLLEQRTGSRSSPAVSCAKRRWLRSSVLPGYESANTLPSLLESGQRGMR